VTSPAHSRWLSWPTALLWRTLVATALIAGASFGVGPLQRADAAGNAASTVFAGQSGRQIVAEALVAARAMGSVTSSSSTTIAGQNYSLVTQANLASGQQTLRVGTAKTVVRVIGSTLYINDNGSDTAIEAQFGVSDPKYANRWIEIPSTNSYFAHFNAFVLLSSLLSEVVPGGSLKTTKVQMVGKSSVVGVTGKPNIHLGLASGSETLYVSTLAPHVPVELVASDVVQGLRETFVITFTNWGKKFAVIKPVTSIAIAATDLPS